MPSTNSFRDLKVWQRAMALVERIYANIGEGSRRKRVNAYLNYLEIALGSQGEVDVQMELAKRLGFCSSADHANLQEDIDRVGRMLNGLITALRRTST